MNTGLQCLCHLEPLISYFLQNKHEEEIAEGKSRGTNGRIARCFASLMQQLWLKEQRVHPPSEMHRALKSTAPHLFQGYQQQDVQEFLAYMIDGLHEDLNLALPRQEMRLRPEPSIEELQKLEEENGEEYVAAAAWREYLERDKSCMVDLFQGQLRSRLTCLECQFLSKRFDPFLYMSVPVSRNMKTLEDAISAFLEGETLSGDEKWRCDKCNKRVDAKKQIDIWKVPQILVLHLKRFEFSAQRCSKIDAHLTSPLNDLDFSRFVSSEQRHPPVFDTCCVAHHSGSYGFGHYTASCKDPRDGRWYNFSDEKVEPVSEDRVFTNSAYVIFLVRKGCEGLMSRQTLSDPSSWPHAGCVAPEKLEKLKGT